MSGDDVRTGLSELDDVLGSGLRRGSLTVIGGHSGAGAMTLARQIACHAAAEQRLSARLLAVGSRARDVQREAIAGQTGVRVSEISHATSGERAATVERVFEGRMTIKQISGAGRTPDELLMAVWLAHAVDRCDVVVIDALGLLIEYDADVAAAPSLPLDSPATADFLRRLRVLALDNDLAIIVAVDLPAMAPTAYGNSVDFSVAHLAALGPAAQVSDTVLLVYRSDQWSDCDPRSGEVDVVVARSPGLFSPRRVTVAHQLHRGRFASFLR